MGDILDYVGVSGTAFVYPDDFRGLDARPASRRWRRLVISLEDDQGVQATHYYAWATEATRRFILELCAADGSVGVLIFARWDPWSIIHVQVTEPGAVQRHMSPA